MSRGRRVNFDGSKSGGYFTGLVLLTFLFCIILGMCLLVVRLLDVLSG